jgi:hypothetical protein
LDRSISGTRSRSPPAQLFEHRVGDVGPPVVVLDVEDELELLLDGGMLCWPSRSPAIWMIFCRSRSNGSPFSAASWVLSSSTSNRRVSSCSGFDLGRQAGDPVGERREVPDRHVVPRLGLAEPFDELQVGADEEVLLGHRRDVGAQQRRDLGTLLAPGLLLVEDPEQLETAVKMRSDSGTPPPASAGGRSWLKNSRFWQ